MTRISEKTARALGIEQARPHKYAAKAMLLCACGVLYEARKGLACPACGRPRSEGIWFPSKKQALRFHALMQLEKQGVIRGLEREKRIGLVGLDGAALRNERGRQISAVIDAVYFEGELRVFEDSKGKDLALSELKRAVLRTMFPCAKIIIT